LFVADRKKHEILVYAADGELQFTFGSRGSGPGQFFRPAGVAFDASRDRILISDKDNHRIQAFSSDGRFISTFGTKGHRPGQLNYPWGLASSPDGSLIAVADSRNHRIQLFTAEGLFLRQFRIHTGRDCQRYKTDFDYPRGITFSLNGKSACLHFSTFLSRSISIFCRISFCPFHSFLGFVCCSLIIVSQGILLMFAFVFVD
jgi:tripartite motif-containing protein 71